ncbi:MAG: STT3 domain-containing protein [Candidatus Omnitrophota bacterium]
MKKRILLYLSLTFAILVNIYFRAYPINFLHLKNNAREAIDTSIADIAKKDVQARFPKFYPTAKDKILKARIAEYKKQNKDAIEEQINKIYLQLKEKYQDPSGQTYLFELDCWHWGRYVENVVKYGHPGDEVIYGKQWDLYMLAPWGFYFVWDQFLYYFTAWIYNLFSIFISVPLFTFLFYVPLLFSFIFIVVLFLYSFRLGGYIGALVSSVFIGLTPMLLHRSCAGWFDKDVLNLIFPLLVVWTYAMGSAGPHFKRRLMWVFFSSFWVALFCFNWTHWWFIFIVIIIYEVLAMASLIVAYAYLCNKRSHMKDGDLPAEEPLIDGKLHLLKEHATSLAVFLMSSFLWILVIPGFMPIEALYNQVMYALFLNKPLSAIIWPNVLYTVGELRKVDIQGIARSMGGMPIFSASVGSLFVLLIRSLLIPKYDGFKRASFVILTIWFFTMFFASMRGVRFLVFLLIPLGVALGCALNELYERL